MPGELLPLFPLAVVLLPRNRLPLHIFEERYKEMIGLAIEENSEFGVVLATNEGIARSGCTATVERVLQQYPDGRMDIVTVGGRRFTISSLDQEKEYLRAEVSFFDDDENEAASELQSRAVEACAEFSPADSTQKGEPYLSFQLAEPITDLEFRQTLLQSRSEPERLRRLIEFAPAYVVRQQRVAHVQEVAPRNGHSRLPVDLGS